MAKKAADRRKTQKTQDKDKGKDKDKDDILRERFNNHWKTSQRARAAVAQAIIDNIGKVFGDCTFANMHQYICEALEDGIEPDAILECVNKCRGWNEISAWVSWCYEQKGVTEQ